MKRAALQLIAACVLCYAPIPSLAQNWTKVLQINGTFGASAYFFNAREGLIGTGHYLSSIPAQIYYTNDGGASWQLARLDNPNIRGEVTDIYFRGRQNGWATIREFAESGWSGIYHSTDGGLTWARIKQAGFPAGIRETKRGVFYTDRDVNPGIMFSSDTGKTWAHIAATQQTLGIDFLDDANGFVTTQASSDLCPHLFTTDGGQSWQTIMTRSEAWTPYGDPISKSFFLSSERDQLTFSTQTAIIKVPTASWTESKIKTYGDSGLTGGIAGSHICQSIIYVQGREPASSSPNGIIRTTDAGASWTFIGGPNNINDKRFAVTGRGAVVIAFDNSGGVWRTTNGGDSTLSPSILKFVTVTPPPIESQAAVCDSTLIPIVLGYHLCDSAQISVAQFLNDSSNELSLLPSNNRFFTSSHQDTLRILYRPAQQKTWTANLRLTIRQPDGYTEDTQISINLHGIAPRKNALAFSETTSPDTIDLDSVSICSDAVHKITLTNTGCSDLILHAFSTSGLPFSLASDFQPFVLSPGTSRTFLIHYTPDSVGKNRGVLYVTHSSGSDSVILLGTAYSSGKAVSLSIGGSISASECDSAQFQITFRNVACKAFAIDSVETVAPFHAGPLPAVDSVRSGYNVTLGFIFIPIALGPDTGSIHIIISYAGTGRYDTTLCVIGIGTIGKPKFSVSRDSVSLGVVPICAEISDTLVIRSSGCADVTVSAAFDSLNGFSLVRNPKPVLSPPDSDLLVIHFHPNKTIGLATSHLIFTTSAGVITVPVSVVVTQSGGTVELSVTPNIQAYTCESQPFTISIADSLCDSITIENITTSGAQASEFSLSDTLPMHFGTLNRKMISGIFTPQDSLTRSATVILKIREADGTVRDTTLALVGQGIAVPFIEVALGANAFHASAGQFVRIPIVAERGSVTKMSTLDFQLLFNTNLLSPLGFSTSGFFGTAATQSFGIAHDTVSIHLQLSVDAILPPGELCELVCQPYVTSVLSTSILLDGVTFHDASGSEQCLTAEEIPDTSAIFTLDHACSDTTLAHFLGFQTIELAGISPNPTTGLVRLTFNVPPEYSGNAIVEIYDALGEKLGEKPLIFSADVTGKQSFDLDLNEDLAKTNEGVRYLRIRTPSGAYNSPVITATVILWK